MQSLQVLFQPVSLGNKETCLRIFRELSFNRL